MRRFWLTFLLSSFVFNMSAAIVTGFGLVGSVDPTGLVPVVLMIVGGVAGIGGALLYAWMERATGMEENKR